jgi:hypothetical protein
MIVGQKHRELLMNRPKSTNAVLGTICIVLVTQLIIGALKLIRSQNQTTARLITKNILISAVLYAALTQALKLHSHFTRTSSVSIPWKEEGPASTSRNAPIALLQAMARHINDRLDEIQQSDRTRSSALLKFYCNDYLMGLEGTLLPIVQYAIAHKAILRILEIIINGEDDAHWTPRKKNKWPFSPPKKAASFAKEFGIESLEIATVFINQIIRDHTDGSIQNICSMTIAEIAERKLALSTNPLPNLDGLEAMMPLSYLPIDQSQRSTGHPGTFSITAMPGLSGLLDDVVKTTNHEHPPCNRDLSLFLLNAHLVINRSNRDRFAYNEFILAQQVIQGSLFASPDEHLKSLELFSPTSPFIRMQKTISNIEKNLKSSLVGNATILGDFKPVKHPSEHSLPIFKNNKTGQLGLFAFHGTGTYGNAHEIAKGGFKNNISANGLYGKNLNYFAIEFCKAAQYSAFDSNHLGPIFLCFILLGKKPSFAARSGPAPEGATANIAVPGYTEILPGIFQSHWEFVVQEKQAYPFAQLTLSTQQQPEEINNDYLTLPGGRLGIQ